ncbi:5'-3' exoribonuclease [Bacteroidia bacterium]|nr:5'-3' exoribonuclease [Bacteroidia bacterium]
MPKPTVDLHIHTVHSDGSQSVAELLGQLRELGIQIASFTDHDCVRAYADLPGLERQLAGLTLLPGAELSFAHHGEVRHMLGYGIDIARIQAYLDEQYSFEKSLANQERIITQFKAICDAKGLQYDPDVHAVTGNNAEAFLAMYQSLISYPENVQKYPFIADNTIFYWDYFANRASDFYVDVTVGWVDLPTIVDTIHSAGGLAFLAHPFAHGLSRDGIAALVGEAAFSGADGVEIQHASTYAEEISLLRSLAARHGLYASGGSDYHGTVKPNRALGTAHGNICITREEIAPWLPKVRTYASGSLGGIS